MISLYSPDIVKVELIGDAEAWPVTPCYKCVNCIENVQAEINGYKGVIIAHWACTFFGGSPVAVEPDGFCKWGEPREETGK